MAQKNSPPRRTPTRRSPATTRGGAVVNPDATTTKVLWAVLVLTMLGIIGIVLYGAVRGFPSAAGKDSVPEPPIYEPAAVVDPNAVPEYGLESSAPENSDQMQPRGVGGVNPAASIDPQWLRETARATGIPQRALASYAGADNRVREEQNCSVGWNTLAAIGYVETHHGNFRGSSIQPDGTVTPTIYGIPLDGNNGTAVIRDSDNGELDGDTEYDRAVGPMQFIPQTWDAWGADGNRDGIADINNLDDAAYSAALYLCQGGGGDLGAAGNWISAVLSYNQSVEYQNQVATTASHYSELARSVSAE